jgi:hypothetical protein
MKIARTTAAVVLLIGGATITVHAGLVKYGETVVDHAAGTASGSIGDTRRSADDIQYIRCSIGAHAGGPVRVSCSAQSTTDRVSCGSDRPELVAVAQGWTDEGFVSFHCTGHQLDYLSIHRGSEWP